MAHATKKVTTEYTLQLTAEESDTLVQLCNNIGGDTQLSARRHTNAIGHALKACGAQDARHPVNERFSEIYFLP